MFIWLQNEFIPKFHVIVIFILIVNQERVVVIKLLMKAMEKRKTTRQQDRLLPTLRGKALFKTKRGHTENQGFKEDQNEQQTSYYQLEVSSCPNDGFWPVSCCHGPVWPKALSMPGAEESLRSRGAGWQTAVAPQRYLRD